jgi:hypothetical protein
MDSTTTSVLAVLGVVVSVGGAIISAINHTRVRSACCGKKLEVSLDVDKTSPAPPGSAPLKLVDPIPSQV